MEVYLSVAAQKKMKLRGVTADEVQWAVRHPQVTWHSETLGGTKCEVRQYGDIGVVVKPMGNDYQVISVIWRTQEKWTDGDMFIDRVIYQSPKVQKILRPVTKPKKR